MAVPEKAAKMATAAARQRLSPAITQQAKAICSGRAFGSSGVCVAYGGVQGLHTLAAQPPYAKISPRTGRCAPLSLVYCTSEAGEELLPH